MKAVNAFSIALAHDQNDLEYMSMQPIHIKEMGDLTYDRLHKIGDKGIFCGYLGLCVIRFKARHHLKINLKPVYIILVDKYLSSITTSDE